MMRQRRRDLELDILHTVEKLCLTEPDSTTEKIMTDLLRTKAKPYLEITGKVCR